MTTTLLALSVAAGHGLLAIYALNSSHGLGINRESLDRVRDFAVVLFGLAGLVIAWILRRTTWTEWPLFAQVYGAACLIVLFVILPALTIARSLRKSPAGVTSLGEVTLDLRAEAEGHEGGWRSRVLRWGINESLRPRIVEWSITLEGLPPGLDGLTILHLTDLHFARWYPLGYFERLLKAASESGDDADLVLITGDILDDDATIPWIAPILGRLRGRLGQVAILGNHDYRHDFLGVRRALRDAGYRTLEGSWTFIESAGCRIALGGTSAPWGRDLFRVPTPDADFRIVLSHAPDEFYRAAERGADLVLAGHNHAGQVRLPLVGPILMPSRFGRRFDRGFFRARRTLMFVGAGIGAKDPLRIGCPPEVVRLTLRSAPSGRVRGEGRAVAGATQA